MATTIIAHFAIFTADNRDQERPSGQQITWSRAGLALINAIATLQRDRWMRGKAMKLIRQGAKVVAISSGLVAVSLWTSASAAEHGRRTAEAGAETRIIALEEQAFAAWKAHDTKFWSAALSKNFVGWGSSGRIGKQAALAIMDGGGCRIAAFRLSGQQLTLLTPDIALLTHKTEVDGTCNGEAVPVARTVTIYVRENGRWKIGYRARSEIVDPVKAIRPAGSERWTSGETTADPLTKVLLARELAMVDAWKDHDAARMDKFFGPSLQFVDIFGNHIGSRTEALTTWSKEGCDVKSFKFTGARATMFTPDFGILTYRASYDATCFGQDVWPIWGTAFYVRHGSQWMWSSGINVLAGSPASG